MCRGTCTHVHVHVHVHVTTTAPSALSRGLSRRPRSAATALFPASALALVLAYTPPPSSFPRYQQRDFFRFETVHESKISRARVGRIHTPHGVIDTPGFVPVATSAALKAVTNEQADAAGVQLMFANTYHLLVHPGPDVVESAGGLHRYMGLGPNRPLITDSGGFQVFSLGKPLASDAPELKRRASKAGNGQGSVLSVSEKGVRFRSYFDSRTISLSPESSVDAQKALGADIIIPLDELPPNSLDREALAASVALSHRWMGRSLRRHLADVRQQAMYAVVHGGTDRELRTQSAEYLSQLPFDGFAVGGSLGATREESRELISYLMPLLPRDRPNHLLGLADPESIAHGVACGVDTFDSCYPTRIARHGTLLTSEAASGRLSIGKARFRDDHRPVDSTLAAPGGGPAPTRAYLHHLYRVNEPTFLALATLHNIAYMMRLMAETRAKILRDEI